ncbi:hypothetical protein GDO81_024781 [Engystomops pustulosus]|uniref:Uncharacterized protein n=1 Tax=Engystomops pustulosus TaxID=76066 RepID=A0AAV6ZM81_ENGPU|nr:hypothetical protein GDO81_024781 [Engystomops pustulosus]
MCGAVFGKKQPCYSTSMQPLIRNWLQKVRLYRIRWSGEDKVMFQYFGAPSIVSCQCAETGKGSNSAIFMCSGENWLLHISSHLLEWDLRCSYLARPLYR